MTGRESTAGVVPTGHPVMMTAFVLAAVLGFVQLSFETACAAEASGYRLAGIVAVGDDYLGLLEIPGGEQVLVRHGSVIEGGGRVLLLDGERLRIELPSGVIELVLDDSGRPAATRVATVPAATVPDAAAPSETGPATASSEAALSGVQLPRDHDGFLFRAVSPTRLGEALSARATTDDRRTSPGIETARRLGPILKLPPNSKVIAVNEQPVTSADEAIALLERSLADNVGARLILTGSDGGPETRVYVSRAGN